jgi:hypothetical protein
MAIGEITKIIPFKQSHNPGQIYLRIVFILENGSFAKTDIVPGFRNYSRWRRIARIGNQIANLRMKNDITVDADSRPILLNGRKDLKRGESTIEELSRLGVFG